MSMAGAKLIDEVKPMDWPEPEVVYYTEHYDVFYTPPPDEQTYPEWHILDSSGVVVLKLALNRNFGTPSFQAKDICNLLEDAYQAGLSYK